MNQNDDNKNTNGFVGQDIPPSDLGDGFNDIRNPEDPSDISSTFRNAVSVNFTLGFSAVLCAICLIITILAFTVVPEINARKITEDNYTQYIDFDHETEAHLYNGVCTPVFNVYSQSEKTIKLTAVFRIECTFPSLGTKEVTVDCLLSANQSVNASATFDFWYITDGNAHFTIKLVSVKGRIMK